MLHGWDNFYILAGTAGATFVGLLFVIVTLGSGWSSSRGRNGVSAFVTPTLVHFCGVLFLAMAILAPWPSERPIGVILGSWGLIGLAYQISTILEKRKQDLVRLRWHDWLPHAGIPALGNLELVAGGAGLIGGLSFAPYAVAGAVTLILATGVYGFWDITLWIVRNRDTL